MNKSIIGLLMLFFSTSAIASTSNGKIIDYWIHNFHDSFAFTVENQTGRPYCASYGTIAGRYVVDTTTEKGKLIATAVMAAKAADTSVHVEGTGDCLYYTDSEDLNWLHVE
ncbi:hypothetical protein [uncultured Shewanella sp.]|uniref:hypothetical protein n=1 Tax=uncultured Shewanella sp. TaxID=173975 RepID=UPI002604B6FE|nr:hypothetical protein [uncultured Shewanella sp.]